VRLPRQSRRKHRSPQSHPVILFVVAECTFAILATAVAEIQSVEHMKPLEAQFFRFGKVHHTLTREGRRYWVVDTNIHFGLLPTHSSRLLLLAETPVAVKVDSIVRMAEMTKLVPLPHSFLGDERNWYLGLTVMGGKVIPVVNPASFLSHLDMNSLEASSPLHSTTAETAGVTA